MYRAAALLLIVLVGPCIGQQCGDTVILQSEQTVSLTSQNAQGCTINFQPAITGTVLIIFCPRLQLCIFPSFCNFFNFNLLKLNGQPISGSNNLQPSYDTLSITYSYQQLSFLAGSGFSCSITASSTTTTTSTTSTTTTVSSNTCNCGTKPSAGRIVGGTTADQNEYPYIARITISSGFSASRCGGSIINEYYILSAAHCVENKAASAVTVNVGDHNAGLNGETNERVITASQITVHSGYNSNTLVNDIALIRLSQPLTFNDAVIPACLPQTTNTFSGKQGVATGWGTTSFQGSVSQILQEVSLPIITNTECQSLLGRGYNIPSTMLCTNDASSNKDACQGDSGGPLAIDNSGRAFLAGVVSWGVGCGTNPGVFTRVSSYIDWIQQNTQETICIPN